MARQKVDASLQSDEPSEGATGDLTPSSSGIVATGVDSGPPESSAVPAGKPRRESDRPSFRALTPYQARLDVAMDDTAVSKVRDPSVSISLGAEHAVSAEGARRRITNRDALFSVVIGTLVGALLVVVLAIAVRALTQ